MKASLLRIILLPLVFVSALSGCSFFGAIGDGITSGYQNTVAYFNSYYNAKRAFDNAEAEILTARLAAGIQGFSDKPFLPPTPSKQKLTIVIDKCSNILQFYPTSAMVDDALLLVGKSYYYQEEYLKSERKFAEFLTQYPGSDLNLDVRAWYVRTLARLKKNDEAILIGEALIKDAEDVEENEIAASVCDVLAVVHARAGRHDRALELYGRMRQYSANTEMKAWSYFQSGEEYSSIGQSGEASVAFREAANLSGDNTMIYLSKLEDIRALRSSGRYDEALESCNSTLDDFRFVKNINELTLERGLTLEEAGRLEEAIDDFRAVDTVAQRTALGSKAAYSLARLYEFSLGDYANARDEYARASTFPVPEFVAEARRRQAAFIRYFAIAQSRSRIDSVLTAEQNRETIQPDTVGPQRPPISIDSLHQELASKDYDLAEVFYVDLENPDSAVYWYRKALEGVSDSVRTPRILYILAELAQSYPDSGYADPKEMFQSIIDSYPSSLYATRARIQLGLPVVEPVVDQGEILYKKAEAIIDSGSYSRAIVTLKKIMTDYPESAYAPKSAYAAGWLYENELSQPDSAVIQYQYLLESYAGSPFAAVVRSKMAEVNRIREDSLKAHPPAKILNKRKELEDELKRDEAPVKELKGVKKEQDAPL